VTSHSTIFFLPLILLTYGNYLPIGNSYTLEITNIITIIINLKLKKNDKQKNFKIGLVV
jgi:hypothetical protein